MPTDQTGQHVIDKWIAFIRTYAYLTDGQALVIALWAIHTWLYERFAAIPYLEIVATAKQSGKSTVLHLLKMLCSGQPDIRLVIRVLSIVRDIEAANGKTTILIDEAESLGSGNLGETRQMMAGSYLEGAKHSVYVGRKRQTFRTFAPYAFAQIGNVHDVLRDRCIEIELERHAPTLYLSEHRAEAREQADACISALVSYSRQAGTGERIPIVAPDWLRTREREIWTPILSIAHWLKLHADTMRLLQETSTDLALLKTLPAKRHYSLQDETDAEDRSMAERVLADIRSVLPLTEPVIASTTLVDRLRAIPTAPWRKWRGTGLDETVLAALLSRYGISPDRVQFGKGRKGRTQARGYRSRDLHAVKL